MNIFRDVKENSLFSHFSSLSTFAREGSCNRNNPSPRKGKLFARNLHENLCWFSVLSNGKWKVGRDLRRQICVCALVSNIFLAKENFDTEKWTEIANRQKKTRKKKKKLLKDSQKRERRYIEHLIILVLLAIIQSDSSLEKQKKVFVKERKKKKNEDWGLLCTSRIFHRCHECKKKHPHRNFTLIFRSRSPQFSSYTKLLARRGEQKKAKEKRGKNLYSFQPRLWTRRTKFSAPLLSLHCEGAWKWLEYVRPNIACAKISIRGCASSYVTRPRKEGKILSQSQSEKVLSVLSILND